MGRISLAAIALTVLTGAAGAQDMGWDSAQGGALVRALSAETAKIRGAAAASSAARTLEAPAPILGRAVGGAAAYPDSAEADAEHEVTLFARRVCGPSRRDACAPYCTPGVGCGLDYPVAATVSTPEGALGYWISDLDFVFPELTVSGGKVLRGTEAIGEVDPRTSAVRLAKGWKIRLVVGSSSGGLCRERGDCPGGAGEPRYGVKLTLEPDGR